MSRLDTLTEAALADLHARLAGIHAAALYLDRPRRRTPAYRLPLSARPQPPIAPRLGALATAAARGLWRLINPNARVHCPIYREIGVLSCHARRLCNDPSCLDCDDAQQT